MTAWSDKKKKLTSYEPKESVMTNWHYLNRKDGTANDTY